MRINRVRAQPSAWTFSIPPIAELLTRYVGDGLWWLDPFCGRSKLAEFRNDHNPENEVARWHMEASDWGAFAARGELLLPDGSPILPPFEGVLFDPPYSYRQVSEHYKAQGKKATPLDTSTQFYSRAMNPICDAIRPGGLAISFGWNSNGFGPARGFEIIEVLLVAHGTHHNDTIVTVERRNG